MLGSAQDARVDVVQVGAQPGHPHVAILRQPRLLGQIGHVADELVDDVALFAEGNQIPKRMLNSL